MNYALEIDAADVLGTRPDATLQEIHDAYRTRAKKHHPDVGGDEWAFRIVTRAYELLSNARLHARIAGDWPWVEPQDEPEPDPREYGPEPSHVAPENPRNATPPPPDHESSWVRAGVEDRVDDPSKVVDVELFTIRYEFSGPLNLLESPKNRNLSSCLNVNWPPPPAHDGDPIHPVNPQTMARLTKAFQGIPKKSKAVASWFRTGETGFTGWISYPTATQAGSAFETLHGALNEIGLGVRQSTREMFIARDSR